MEETRRIAREPFYTGNVPNRFKKRYENIYFSNYGSSSLTVNFYSTVGENSPFLTLVIPPYSVFDEYVDPFQSITVTGASSFSGFVRGSDD